MESIKYYGDRIVSSTIEENGLTTINFTIGESIVLPSDLAAVVVTDTAVDASVFRDNKVFFIAGKMIEIMLKYGLLIKEVDYTCQRVIMSVQKSLERANEIKWGKPFGEATLSEVDIVLKQ